jgi:hypothetical protein
MLLGDAISAYARSRRCCRNRSGPTTEPGTAKLTTTHEAQCAQCAAPTCPSTIIDHELIASARRDKRSEEADANEAQPDAGHDLLDALLSPCIRVFSATVLPSGKISLGMSPIAPPSLKSRCGGPQMNRITTPNMPGRYCLLEHLTKFILNGGYSRLGRNAPLEQFPNCAGPVRFGRIPNFGLNFVVRAPRFARAQPRERAAGVK